MSVKFDMSGLNDALETIEAGARRAVNQTLEDIAEEARLAAPIDSGALRASIYVALDGGDAVAAHALAEADARRADPGVEIEPAASNDTFDEEGMHFGAVAACAAHGSYIETGFAGREGTHFFENAGNAMEDSFEGRLGRIAGELGGK